MSKPFYIGQKVRLINRSPVSPPYRNMKVTVAGYREILGIEKAVIILPNGSTSTCNPDILVADTKCKLPEVQRCVISRGKKDYVFD